MLFELSWCNFSFADVYQVDLNGEVKTRRCESAVPGRGLGKKYKFGIFKLAFLFKAGRRRSLGLEDGNFSIVEMQRNCQRRQRRNRQCSIEKMKFVP